MNKLLSPYLAITIVLLSALACNFSAPTPTQDLAVFNTQIAQTAQAQLTLLALAQPIPTTAAPATLTPTLTATIWPPILYSGQVALPRHMTLDLDTQSVSGTVSGKAPSFQNVPPGIDLVFYAPYPNTPDWQFLSPLNNARVAYYGKNAPGYQDCVAAFKQGPKYDQISLDSSVFVTDAGGYACYVTDRGKLGSMRMESPTGDYVGMDSVNLTLTIWDAPLP
jgi:hypothetical protein